MIKTSISFMQRFMMRLPGEYSYFTSFTCLAS